MLDEGGAASWGFPAPARHGDHSASRCPARIQKVTKIRTAPLLALKEEKAPFSPTGCTKRQDRSNSGLPKCATKASLVPEIKSSSLDAPVCVPKQRTSFTLFMVALLFTVRSTSFAGQGHNCVFLRSESSFRVRRSSFASAPSCTACRTATSARRPLDRIVAKEVRRTSMSCTATCCRAGGPRDFFDLPDTSQEAHRP